MVRDFRPKDKKQAASPKDRAAKPQANGGKAAQPPRDFRPAAARQQQPPNGRQTRFNDDSEQRAAAATPSEAQSETDDGEEGTEEELREAIAALGGEEGDMDLISSKALKSKGKGKQNEADEPGLGDELKAFMKGLNLPTDVVIPPAAGPSKSPAKAAAAEPAKEAVAAAADPKNAASPPRDADRDTRAADKERTKKEKREERRRMAEAQKAAAEENKRKASKVEEIAQKAKDAAAAKKKAEQQPKASSFMADAAKPQAKTTVKEATSQLLVMPAPQWMGISVDALEGASSSSSSSAPLSHDKVVSLLADGNAILSSENATYHSLLNSGSHSMTAALGGLTPSDAKFISSLLGDTSSISGSAGGGGTLSDRIAAHALLLGSSPLHNLRSLDALVTMAGKKSREESGRATRALADWFAGAGLGSSGRKLRYFRDQPELAATATASASRGKQQRLCLFAFEDRLKKTYFSFLQTLETQSHDPLPFVRQQAVSQTFILLREKSEQEQNLMRLLVNKLGDGEKSVASKATNNLLELLNVHPNMKAIVTREVGELIRKPTRSTARAADKETTKRHHNHAKYYGVLALNQIMLTRQDVPVANSLIQLYFELFEEALNEEAMKPDADKADGEDAEQQPKKKKDRWRDKKGKKGGKGNDNNNNGAAPAAVAETEGKMMAAILTGVRRAFPFAQLETNVFDKHLSTLFRITHSSSFNIAVQALQLIYVVATSSTTTSTALIDRFHSSLYSSMLDNRLATTSKTAMYLNLCFKAMRDDVDEERRAAEVKRLVQILAHMDVEFVCGALFLIGELIRAHPRLRGMITDPEDDDEEVVRDQPEEGEDDADETTATKPLTASTPSTSYDARKRDPRFARAAPTCLWEVHPLLHHHHPTVRLLTTQLIQGKALTTTPDLTLYSLSHFLDRFVYRNAKKPSATSNTAKGASGMQPAIAAAGSGKDGVRKVKGWVGDEVNTEKFWKKKVEDVPVDSVFFHHYFTLKGKRDAKAGGKKGKKGGSEEDGEESDEDEDEEMESVGSDIDVDEADAGSIDDDDDDGSGNDTDDSEEREIWKAMKATMPAEDGDAELMEDSGDEDDEDLAELDYTDSEEEEAEEDDDEEAAADQDDASSDDGEEGMFDEEEDGLLPFAEFDDGASSDEEGASATAGKKRGRDEVDEEDEGSKPKSKSQQRRAERKKRKAMPTFASADDYAHLLGGDDDEDDA